MYFLILKSVQITEIVWITEYMCRYNTQPGLLTALLEYLTVLLEYLDLSILICLKILQIPFRIIQGTDKQGSDN